MAKDFFAPSEGELKEMLSRAWTLARFTYADGADAERFMENPHKKTLGTENTAQELETPVSLIENYGQQGFDRVEESLLATLEVREPSFFGS